VNIARRSNASYACNMGHEPKNLRSPAVKTYTVTFSDGSTKAFEGTHLLESPEGDLLIWND
jgi:hypothetical protein